MFILTLNCRTHSIRYQLFDPVTRKVAVKGAIERIELGDSFLTVATPEGRRTVVEADCPDCRSALSMLLGVLASGKERLLAGSGGIAAVTHRVAHGGERFTRSTLITPEVLAGVRACAELAPLHNPPNIAGIEAAQALLPAVPHIAVFDTAFHQTMPEHAYTYPLPYEWYERHGIRRYGFHGPSHRYAVEQGAALLGKPPAECNLITVHVGNGVSLCAVRKGDSIDTSMGLTPLEGVAMETRCGDIDPGIVTFIMQEEGLSPREMERVLNDRSGVLGITGSCATRKAMLAGAADGDERCRLALEICAYRLRKYIGAYIAAVGPLDAILFVSAVQGSEWPVRAKALTGMEGFGIHLDRAKNRAAGSDGRKTLISAAESPVRLFVIPADEELAISEEGAAVLASL